MSTETIEAMALAIDRRMGELDLPPSDLVRETGYSWTTIGKVRRGERINYSRKLKSKLCRVLEWTPNSIDLMFQGEPPIPSRSTPHQRYLFEDDEQAAADFADDKHRAAFEAAGGNYESPQGNESDDEIEIAAYARRITSEQRTAVKALLKTMLGEE